MGLVVKISLDGIAPPVLPKTKVAGAYNDYMTDLYEKVLPLIADKKKLSVINKEISKVNNIHRDSIKEYMKENIAKSKDFAEIAATDSFGITLNARVNQSVNYAMRQARQQTLSLNRRMATETIQDQADAYIANYINNISKSLGYDSSRLIKFETRQNRMTDRITSIKSLGKKVNVIWKLGDNENHCEICVGYAKEYSDIRDVPEYPPIHPNCYCDLIVIEEETKTEIKTINKENVESRKNLNIN